ncbi:MAG TPA: AEC family transporter [Anaerolineales bacterium]
MIALLALLLNNLLPIFLIAGLGYLLSKRLQLSPRSFSQIIFYIFNPCLVFTLIVHSQLSDSDILRTTGFAALVMISTGAIAWLGGKLLRLDRRTMAAVLLSSTLMNAGNFGLPVILFAFGEQAMAYGSLYFVTMMLLSYTVGIIIASMGTASLGQALTNLLKVPMLYALVLAFIFLRFQWQLPLPLDRTVKLLSDASVPSMILLLGMQFQVIEWTSKITPLAFVSVLRLLVAPALAFGLNLVIGLSGPARQASILESGMPTAVLTTILATEYDAEPSFVTAAVFTTTLLSSITLTLLISTLGV